MLEVWYDKSTFAIATWRGDAQRYWLNAVESVLCTELLEVIPKTLAEACMRHGYCTAEIIVWYIMKQLILPPDINEVTCKRKSSHLQKSLQPLLIKHLNGSKGNID